ncbi:uncharacterized protein LOC120107768 [Phoenix dactylifera]|uniref:Uncharacterized protein LOC120107768 n=1 Tax=Phoenix dactylifera TaxID=42345 RepID=A0A8B8ZUT7_PHODC|nr:uncharacterized protein LOC120107768 [Phoenix dactylifera]
MLLNDCQAALPSVLPTIHHLSQDFGFLLPPGAILRIPNIGIASFPVVHFNHILSHSRSPSPVLHHTALKHCLCCTINQQDQKHQPPRAIAQPPRKHGCFKLHVSVSEGNHEQAPRGPVKVDDSHMTLAGLIEFGCDNQT